MIDDNHKLLGQLLEESEVMAEHALSSGRRVPDKIVEGLVRSAEILSACRKLRENGESMDAPEPEGEGNEETQHASEPEVEGNEENQDSSEPVIEGNEENPDASDPGIEGNDENPDASEPGIERNEENPDVSELRNVEKECEDLPKQLSRIHGQLAQIVKPALPGTLKLIHDQKDKSGWRRKLGPVPLVQNMVIAALISIAIFIVFSGLARSIEPGAGSGITKFIGSQVELITLLSAAGMGASYLALYQANRLVVEGIYDPKYNSSYWIRFVLGLISGVILAEVITQTNLIPTTGDMQLGKIVLALLGGFSASVVYRILTRLVEAIESIFRGDENERIAAKEQALQAKLEEQNAQERLEIGSDLMKLGQQIGSDLDEAKTKEEINKIFAKLMPTDFDNS